MNEQKQQYFYCQYCRKEKKIEFLVPGHKGFDAKCTACEDKPVKKKSNKRKTARQMEETVKYLTRYD